MTDAPLFRRILVPLDGSTVSNAAIPHARRLAALFEADLWFVTVDEPGAAPVPDAALEAAAGSTSGRSSIERIAGGDPQQRIAELNDRHPDALCCMSTIGRATIGRAVLGSVARAVVDRSVEPVVLVGPSCRATTDAITHLTVALDGSEESERSVRWASAWSHHAGVPLELIRVVDPLPDPAARVPPTEAQLDDLRYVHLVAADLESPESVHSANLTASDPVEALSQHLHDFDTSLLAMSTRPADPLAELVVGSVAASMIRRSPAPVALTSRTDRRR